MYATGGIILPSFLSLSLCQFLSFASGPSFCAYCVRREAAQLSKASKLSDLVVYFGAGAVGADDDPGFLIEDLFSIAALTHPLISVSCVASFAKKGWR